MSERNSPITLGLLSGIIIAVIVTALVFALIFAAQNPVPDTPDVVISENIPADESLEENDDNVSSEQNIVNSGDTSRDSMANIPATPSQTTQIVVNSDQQTDDKRSTKSHEIDQDGRMSVENDANVRVPDTSDLNIINTDQTDVKLSAHNQLKELSQSLLNDDSNDQISILASEDKQKNNTRDEEITRLEQSDSITPLPDINRNDDNHATITDLESDNKTSQTSNSMGVASLPPPFLDILRVSRDGNVIVSGRTVAGSAIDVLINGQVTISVEADSRGNFVAVFSIPDSKEPRVLTLRTRTETQQTAMSDEFIIAPTTLTVTTEEDTSSEVETVANSQSMKNFAQNSEQQEFTESIQSTDVPILRIGENGPELMSANDLPSNVNTNQIALDTVGYDTDGSVLLSGRSLPHSNVIIYLDDRFTSDILADQTGRWNVKLSNVTPGNYRLRIDQVNEERTVMSRLETPFRRESIEKLKEAQSRASSPSEELPVAKVTIQRGDTLWAISRQRYGRGILYVRIFEANQDSIRDPDLIYPGQVFTLPE